MKHSNPCFFLVSGGYGIFNREFAADIGLAPAVMLSELLELEEHFQNDLVNSPKHGDGFFYATIDKIQQRTGISRKEQESAIKKLVNLEFIQICVFGLPATRYFRINKDKILEYFGFQKTSTVCTKGQTGLYKGTNLVVQKDKLVLIDKKEPEEEPEEEEIHAPTTVGAQTSVFVSYSNPAKQEKSPSVAKKVPMTSPAHNVTVTVEEHAKLVEKFGIELVKEGYQHLSEWKDSANPKQVAKHSSDYWRLRKWAIYDLIEEKSKSEKQNQLKIAPHRRGSKLVTQGDYEKDDYRAPRL